MLGHAHECSVQSNMQFLLLQLILLWAWFKTVLHACFHTVLIMASPLLGLELVSD